MRRRFLTVCNGGVVRSVTLGAILKYWFDQDAIAMSLDKNKGATFDMLCQWADVIVVVESWMVDRFLGEYRHKVRVVEIGPDIWGQSNDPHLVEVIMAHDLPAILGVSSARWARKSHHKTNWEEHRAKLRRRAILRAGAP